MFETPIAIVGTVVNDPVRRRVGDREVYRFRVASNTRRRTPEGVWESGDSLFVSVSCWNPRLIAGAGAALGRGSAVIVVGSVHTSEYDDRDGNRRTSTEVRASAVGPDLSRCIARVEPLRHVDAAGPLDPPGSDDPSAAAVAEAAGTGECTGDDAAEDAGEDVAPEVALSA